jgi:alcohol dehydrogenase class IV
MVKPFQFAALPGIFFGPGTISGLPGHIRKYGKSVLLITGKRSFTGSDRCKSLMLLLKEQKIDFDIYSIPGEPSPLMINEAVGKYSNKNHSVVVAIGGGSVMDAGKAISAMMPLKTEVKEYLEGVGTKDHPGVKVPFIAVPTTSGTGSEATRNAVISVVGKDGFKKSLRHDNFVPDIAIVDPELTLSCPPDLTAASGMDCFTQLVEAYLSDKSNDYTDVLSLRAIARLASSLKIAFEDGSDIEARTGMSFAALTSGICLANAGLGTVHGFASSLGALYNIPHGVVCGTLMAPANEINVRELRKTGTNLTALAKYATLGKIFNLDISKSDDYSTDYFIEVLYNLTDDLKLPGFEMYGVKGSEIERIVDMTDNKNNPVKLNPENLKEIILKRI